MVRPWSSNLNIENPFPEEGGLKSCMKYCDKEHKGNNCMYTILDNDYKIQFSFRLKWATE